MSTAKEKIEKLKKILFGEDSPAQKFLSATTADGVALTIEGESLTEGAAVTLEDGTPAPDGEHTLSDGTVITIAEGKISAIKAAEPVEKEMAGETKAAIETLKGQLADVLSKFNSQQKEIQTLKADSVKREQAFAAQKEAVSKLVEVVEEMANEPAAEPVVKKKSMFAKDKPNPADRAKEIAEAMKKINTQS